MIGHPAAARTRFPGHTCGTDARGVAPRRLFKRPIFVRI